MFIDHDFHLHTHLSLCAVGSATAQAYIDNARRFGFKKLGITDHMWDTEHLPMLMKKEDYAEQAYEWLQGYNKQNYTHTLASRAEFDAVEHPDIQVLFGCECEYDYERRDIAITPQVAEQLDLLVVPHSHTHLIMPKRFAESDRTTALFLRDSFMDIVNSPNAKYVTSIAHPFDCNNKNIFRVLSDEEFAECFSAAAAKNIAIEINSSSLEGCCGSFGGVKDAPIMRMFRIAKSCGCQFIFGSDSHSKDGQNNLPYNYIAAAVLELTEQDICPLARS